MTIETGKQTKIYETPEETRDRLGERMVRFTNLRIDLTRVSKGLSPEYSALAMRYSGPIQEAMNITNHELFNTWQQIQETGDNLLTVVLEHERGRLRDFFNTPLDGR